MTRPPMIVATMASLSSREKLLERTVASLLPQIDALCVYLNGYETVPACLRHPKVVHAVLSKEAGWRGAEAKLWFWDRDAFKAAPEWQDDDIAIVVDDDIVYPPDYTARLIASLDARPGSIACVHGSILHRPFVSYLTDRHIARARDGLDIDHRVHVPGTGTMAFRRGDLDISLRRDITWSHCVDVMTAIAAKAQGREVWTIARPDAWLQPMALPKGTGIFRQRSGAGQAGVETERLIAAEPWPEITLESHGFVVRGGKPAAAASHPPPNVNSMLPPQVATWLSKRLRGCAGTVVEIGSGHGSARLAAALPPGCRLVSLEHDARFVGIVPSTSYVHAPIVDGWYDYSIVDGALPPAGEIAAVVVDGPPRLIGRSGVLRHLERLGSGPVVVDDVHRPADLEVAREIGRLRGIEPVIHRLRHAQRDRAFATIG